MFYRLSGRALLAAALAGTAFLLWPRTPLPGQPVGPPVELPHPKPGAIEYHGAASCSSMACHNFNGPRGSCRSEFTTWAADDKHAQAFAVLFNERSDRIMKNLTGSTEPGSATKHALCLRCHATNDGRCDNAGEKFALADGVGCEACHGPAEKYLDAHYKDFFKHLSVGEKHARFGLYPTKDLHFRTQLCSSCHVGDNTREVNHDLIAAGHPRLSFEMSGYHGIYSGKHWSDEAEKKRHPDFYARLWLVGQLETSKAAVDLLVSRAEGEKAGKPWPEFSEYACFACHKDFEVDSPRQRAGFQGRVPGALPYGTWYLSNLGPLNGPAGYVPKEIDDSVSALKKAMQRPGPSAADVASTGRKLSGQLRSLLASTERARPLDGDQILSFMRALVSDALKKTNRQVVIEKATDKVPAKTRDAYRIDEMDWDEATQLYLGLAALLQSLHDCGAIKNAPPIREEMLALKNRLKASFPFGYDSPRDYDPLEKPAKGIPAVKDYLESIRSRLGS